MAKSYLCLNGEWDFMPIYGTDTDLDLPDHLIFEKEKIRVPSSWRYVTIDSTPYFNSGFGVIGEFQPFNTFDYPKEWSAADKGIYRRNFRTPGDMFDSRVFLRFDGIIQRSIIYLNGKAVADWDEAYLPLKTDVTDFIKWDGTDNELIVVCTVFEEVTIPSGAKKYLGLTGSWFGNVGRGIWQDVFLESKPAIYIDDSFVKTSYRDLSIETDVRICNTSSEIKKVDIEAYICDNGREVMRLVRTGITVGGGSGESIVLGESWEEPHLWMPDDPFLYFMQIVLLESGKEIDRKEIRFGFREIWSEGHKLMLNGVRINLRGDCWHFQGAAQQTKEYALNWFAMCRENGLNFVRLHAEPYPEYYLDAADETGMLIVDETAIYGSAKSMPADDPVYIGMCRRHIRRLVKRDRNHPSVIVWSLENEMRWVDGRDAFKLEIPHLLKIIKELDDTRPVILEGDNRLISKEDIEIESRHYNIDGTILQWDKKRPLIFGEHGGWWYICPQNSSAYIGLKAYLDYVSCSLGFALKEKLYVEYARKNDVTGISTFNFAHYLMHSMPDEDMRLDWESFDTPGCKPRVIRKHSLTINNGFLKGYPAYIPSTVMDYLKEAYKPVTIIPSEYNTSFFDDSAINRSFDVYNETLGTQQCIAEVHIRMGGNVIYKEVFEFIQEPGERKDLHISFIPPQVDNPAHLSMEAVLYHNGREMHRNSREMYRLSKIYKLYPASLKYDPIDTHGKSIAYFGNAQSLKILKNLIPGCREIHDIGSLENGGFDILIIGCYIDCDADEYQEILREFVKSGGILIQLEQSRFCPGDLVLDRRSFFSAHTSNPSHEILKGLSDEDFIFWSGFVLEETPDSIIEQCFVKPVKGDFEMILECSSWDFGDGGDLWTPLIEYRYKNGTMIFNQLEITENYRTVPQACILLRNIISHAAGLNRSINRYSAGLNRSINRHSAGTKRERPTSTALLADLNSPANRFANRLGLFFDRIDGCHDLGMYTNLIVDMSSVNGYVSGKLRQYAAEGGNVMIFPVDRKHEKELQELLGCQVTIQEAPAYLLEKVKNDPLTDNISIVDLFKYEKVHLCPRNVENIPVCNDSMEVEGGEILLESVEGTPWHEYFVNNQCSEYSRVALADICKKNRTEGLPYLVRKRYGAGCFIISQLSADWSNEKNIRCYTRLISNMGSILYGDIFSYIKTDKDYAINSFMTLPHREYVDYSKMEAYFSDRDYSLNNLGEGLYGWMKKVEGNPSDGFIEIKNSSGHTYFLTCFVEYINRAKEQVPYPQPDNLVCKLLVEIRCGFKLWINGQLMKEYKHESRVSGNKQDPIILVNKQDSRAPVNKQDPEGPDRISIDGVVLNEGLNRMVFACGPFEEDIRLRPVLKLSDGSYPDNVRYRLTIDEVDPK